MSGRWSCPRISSQLTLTNDSFATIHTPETRRHGARLEEQLTVTANDGLPFDERLGLLVDREMTWRDWKRLWRLPKAARFKSTTTYIDDRVSRSLGRRLIAYLAAGDLISAAVPDMVKAPIHEAPRP